MQGDKYVTANVLHGFGSSFFSLQIVVAICCTLVFFLRKTPCCKGESQMGEAVTSTKYLDIQLW